MIEVKHLYKSFGNKEVLKDINTVFEDGKTNLIIGQSGAGKTVLMRSLTGLLDPTSGEVLYDGRNFVNMTKKEKILMRREMGMIFQGAALFDSLTVLENVRFPLDMFSDMTSQERDKRAMECLERVNLTGAEEKFPGEISGGMQKRVAIARAIVMNPKYLFCDEPNSGLDPKTSLVIDELLTSITREFNMTTIINTHDMNSVMGIGENIIFIADGRKEWQGNKDTVISSHRSLKTMQKEAWQDCRQASVRLRSSPLRPPKSAPETGMIKPAWKVQNNPLHTGFHAATKTFKRPTFLTR